MVAGPEISRLVDEYSALSGKTEAVKNKKHHEDTFSFQKEFFAKVRKLKETLLELGNPFEEESADLYALDTKEVADSSVNETMKQLASVGQKQFDKLLKGMADTQKPSFNEPLTKNKLPLFSRKAKPDQSAAKRKIDVLKDDCQLFSRLFISCQSRKCDLQAFFSSTKIKTVHRLCHRMATFTLEQSHSYLTLLSKIQIQHMNSQMQTLLSTMGQP